MPSPLEDLLCLQLVGLGLPEPVREYRFCLERRYRADFAWPEHRLLVEVEGGVYIRGRHVTPSGYEGDVEKYNLAQELGWRVLRFTGHMVRDGSAVLTIERVLRDKERRTND